MKLKSLTIRHAGITANDNVVLRFKGFPDTIVSVKPLAIIIARLTPIQQDLIMSNPDNLVGATISATDFTLDGNTIKGEIVSFKAGDKYIAQDFNTEVRDGHAKVGDELECKTDGIRIQGSMEIELHPDVQDVVNTISIQVATQKALNRTSSAAPRVAKPTSSRLTAEVAAVSAESIEGLDPNA